LHNCHKQVNFYFFYVADDVPVPALLAVAALQEVEDKTVEGLLGYKLVTKAEPYSARAERRVSTTTSQTHFLMAALIVSAFVIVLVVLALLFILHRYVSIATLLTLTTKHRGC
jgi:hypothetical protein